MATLNASRSWIACLLCACGSATKPTPIPHLDPPIPPTVSSCPRSAPEAPKQHARQMLHAWVPTPIQAVSFSADGRLGVVGEDGILRVWDPERGFLLRLAHTKIDTPAIGVVWESDHEVAARDIWGHWSLELGTGAVTNSEHEVVFPAGQEPTARAARYTSFEFAQADRAATSKVLRLDASGMVAGSTAMYWPDRDTPTATVMPLADPRGIVIAPRGDAVVANVLRGKRADELESDVIVIATKPSLGTPRTVWTVKGNALPRAITADLGLIAVSVQLVGRRNDLVVLDATGTPRWRRPADTDDAGRLIGAFSVAAFAPDGRTLAVGTSDGRVVIFDARTGRLRRTLGSASRPAANVRFAGTTVVAVSPWEPSKPIGRVAAWSLVNGTLLASEALPAARLVDVAPTGELVGVTSDGQRCSGNGRELVFKRWAKVVSPSKPVLDLSTRCIERLRDVDAIDLAHGLVVLVIGEAEFHLVVLDLATGKQTPLDGSDGQRISQILGNHGFVNGSRWVTAGEFAWDVKTGKQVVKGLGLRDLPYSKGEAIYDALSISLGGERAAISSHRTLSIRELKTNRELHRITLDADVVALTYGADPHVVLVGDANGTLHVIRDGQEVEKALSEGGAIDDVVVSADGKRVATTSDDGAIRLWDAATGRLEAAFAEFSDDEWIVYTPQGAYGGTGEVADRVGWVFDAPLEGFAFEQFAASFHDPALVTQRLAGADRDVVATVTRPPRVTLSAPATSDAATARIRVTASAPGRVDTVRAFVEGRPVAERAICKPHDELELEVALRPGVNRVSVVASDAHGFASTPVSVDIVSTAKAARSDIWVVAVGIDRYPGLPADLQLAAADDDARAIAKAFGAMAPTSFGTAHVTELLNEAATPAAISAALDGLAAMKPDDLAIVFFAGHGVKPRDDADMVFVTGGAQLGPGGGLSDQSLRRDGIAWTRIGSALARARGRVLVLLDACHSGHVSQKLVVPNEALATSLVRDQRAGAIVFAASKGRQESFEGGTPRGMTRTTGAEVRYSKEEPHGFFTGALLASLVDMATDRNDDGLLQLSEIIDDVTYRVTRATSGKQTPWVVRRELIGDFAVVPAHR